MPDWLLSVHENFRTIVATLAGLTVGSFLNVVIWRLPRGENLNRPRSKCPGCGMLIRWFDNMPVLSWLLLRGRCRKCRMRISARYPGVELLTGALFLCAALAFADHIVTLIVACLALAALVAISFIDWDHKIIPDVISIPGTILAIATAPFTWLPQHPATLLGGIQAEGAAWAVVAITGAAAGAGAMWSIRWGYRTYRKKEPMRLRDLKLWVHHGAAAVAGALVAPFVLDHAPGVGPGLDALAIAMLGATVGGGIIRAIRWIGGAILKKEAMGLGDVKLMAFLGALVGPLYVLYVLVIGSVTGAVIGILIFLIAKHRPMPCQVRVQGEDFETTFDAARVEEGEIVLRDAPDERSDAAVRVTWVLPADRVLEDDDARIEAKGTIVRTDPGGTWRIQLKRLSETDDERVFMFRNSYKYIPFGPFLAAGGVVALLAGPAVHHFATVTYPEFTRGLLS